MSGHIDVPVIIIGGGGCGLSLSVFLSDYGVEHILFERHAGTSILPKAHYLNQRTMETFRLHGMNHEIARKGCPPRQMSQVAWATSLGGDEHLDRRVIHKFSCFGGDDGSSRVETYKRDAPELSANLPLCRMEPILRQLAAEKNQGRILFGHTVTSFSDEGDFVLVTVQDTEQNIITYRAQYLVGADGGRTVGSKIGVVMEGLTGITDMVSVHFGADLSQYWDDRLFACHFINGSCGTIFESGAIVPMGPTWGKKSEEWVFHFGFELNDEARFQEDKLVPRIRKLLKIPDMDIKVHKISHWIIERVLANKYRENRIFIAGDAAHRRPPTTGLGLNTAIEDSLNLAWKLALVLGDKASPDILSTYEQERRPVGRRNCDWGLFTFRNSAVINAAVGLIPGQEESNKLRFEALFEESDTGQSLRAQVCKMIESQCIEFSAHDIELGFKYNEGFKISDGSEAPPSDPLAQIYNPSTCPGNRLPHAWLEVEDTVISTHDLVGPRGAFLVITDEHGTDWLSASKRAGIALGVEIRTAQIGCPPHIRDYEDQWEKVKGIQKGGALLVRPDNFVAWRSLRSSQRLGAELEEAVKILLGKSAKASKVSSTLANGTSCY